MGAHTLRLLLRQMGGQIRRMGGQFGRMGAHTLSHGTEKNRELKEKGEASPPTLKRVEASPNGQQEKVSQLREISDKAKAIMARLPIKHLPFEPRRWKEGDPDPEPNPEEETRTARDRKRSGDDTDA